MKKDHTEGLAKEAKGSVAEAIGKLTGNEKIEAQGAAEKADGKSQAEAGKVADAAKDGLR